LNLVLRISISACFAVTLSLFCGSVSFADDVIWNGSVNNSWENGQNWQNDAVPADGDNVFIAGGTVNYSTASGTSGSLQAVFHTGGRLNILGGELRAFNRPNSQSDFDSQVVQTGGIADVNAAQIGSASGTDGSYSLSGGTFKIGRSINEISLFIGANRSGSNAGVGSFTISGGSFTTRVGVKLGDDTASGTGSFAVMGSRPSEIAIGGANDDFDGTWQQHAGSSLTVRFDNLGCTPIILKDNPGSTGASAVFESGSILDVDHLSGQTGGTWTVMEVENGNVVDNGLAFAPGVDTSVWSFEVDNSGTNGRLLVTAVGDPFGFDLVVGNQTQQRMRYGMDYERLWFWTSSLNTAERQLVAKWSAIDTRIDYIRVAINAEYELVEGTYDLRAYTDRIIPMMQKMQEANPDLKFFASPRPLHEAYPSSQNVAWQPYPLWITGNTNDTSSQNQFHGPYQRVAKSGWRRAYVHQRLP